MLRLQVDRFGMLLYDLKATSPCIKKFISQNRVKNLSELFDLLSLVEFQDVNEEEADLNRECLNRN